MAGTEHRKRVGLAAAVGAAALLSGCSHFSGMRWPWSHNPPPPVAVNELVITTQSGTAATYPQYWKRNTLLVDLHDASQEGALVVQSRLPDVPRFGQGAAEVRFGVGILRIQPHGSLEMDKSAGEVALRGKCVTQIVVRVEIARPGF